MKVRQQPESEIGVEGGLLLFERQSLLGRMGSQQALIDFAGLTDVRDRRES